ncbi:MAG: iron-sulfur cluster assembly scaffold protein [Patescibacteria group bacterium]
MYNQKTLATFKSPKNYGEIKNPDGLGIVGNVTCGDVMWLYLKIAKNKAGEDFIKDIKFKTFGCVAAIATSSVITELAKNKTLGEALKLNKQDIIEYLGGLPELKHHCSILAIDALAEASYDYFKKTNQPISAELEEIHQKNERSVCAIENRLQEFSKAKKDHDQK